MALRDWQMWGSSAAWRKRKRRGGGGRTPARSPRLAWDLLESRLAPAVSTWSGAVNNLWSNDGNWDNPPVAGNDLVFPATATNYASTDDLAAGTSFASLTVAGNGYTIDGNAIALSGTIDSSQPSGTSTVDLPINASGGGPLAVTVDQSGTELVLGGPISGSGGLTLSGSGTLDLTGANTYIGTTAVTSGVLDADSAQPGTPVTLAAGATLGGSGTVGTITSTAATVNPGHPAPGVLTDGGDLNLDSASTFNVALNGETAGSDYSQLVVAGQVNLGGATLNPTAGFTPTGNESFTIVDNTGASAVEGIFAGQPQGSTLYISGQPYSISYTGGDGNDVVLTSQVVSTTSLAAASNAVVSGQPVTLTATVSWDDSSTANTPSGTVEFLNGSTSLGTASLSDGTATLSDGDLPVGSDSITAQYEGDANFTASTTSAAVSVDVSQAGTTSSLTVTPNPSAVGSSVTLTATVAVTSPGTGTPTGTVEFFSGSTDLGTTSLSGGTASLSTSALTQGSDSITAQYSGDSNFTASTSPAVVATANLASSTTLSASPASFASGQTITLTATVTASGSSSSTTPTGTVEFFNGGTSLGSATLSSGVATLSSVSLSSTSSLTATYEGDANYSGSTSTALTVPLVQSSTTTVTTSPNPSEVGQSVTIAAAVANTGTVPTGDIMFLSNGVPLGTVQLDSSGSAILTLTTLPAGSDAITAQYSGDSNYASGTSPAVTQTVSQASSTTTLTVAPLVSSAGQSVTLSVNVAAASGTGSAPTGTVTFLSGSTTLGTATLDDNGNASLVTTTLPVGTSPITAQYSGDSNYAASTSAAVTPTVSAVTQASTITLTASSTNPSAFSSVQFTASVAPAGSATTTPTGTVVFFANGALIGSATLDASGNATFSNSDLAVGSETILAFYQGDSNYSSSNSANLAITVGTGDELFVNQMYLTILGRSAEQAGLTAWTTDLQDGFSRQQVVRLIMTSPEAQAEAQVRAESSNSTTTKPRYLTPRSSLPFKEQRINSDYEAILGRPADPEGLQFFIDVVNDGLGGRTVRVDLLGSDEYYSDITNELMAQSS